MSNVYHHFYHSVVKVAAKDGAGSRGVDWPVAAHLAWRYLRGRRSRLLHRTALAAFASVTLGVMAMVVAMALMSGYRHDLESKLVAGNAAVLAYPLSISGETETRTRRRVEALPGVTEVEAVAYGQGTLTSPDRPAGETVTLRGVGAGLDPLVAEEVDLGEDANGTHGAVLGAELASQLEVEPGDVLRLVALGFDGGAPRFRYVSVRVEETFASGFAEFDRQWVVLDRDLVERLAGGAGERRLYEIAVVDPAESGRIAARVQEILGEDFLVTDWRALNRELFSALRLQQLALFFLLGLIVVVSTFNVASTLMVLVRERLRDLGVLAALGLDRFRLAAIFPCYGLALAGVGIALGLGLGSGISWLLSELDLIRFDPGVAAIYFVSSVPFRIEGSDLLAIAAFAALVTMLATVPPAWRVARLDISDALRYE